MTPEIIMALQTAHPVDYMGAGRATKEPEITPAVAAAMAAGMKRKHWVALRWVYCNDSTILEELRDLLWRTGADIAAKENWPDETGEILDAFVDLVLFEGGQIKTPDFGPVKNEAGRQAYLGWHKSRWYRWRRRYEGIYTILQDLVNDGRRHLVRAQALD
jgi:hypothetical protein